MLWWANTARCTPSGAWSSPYHYRNKVISTLPPGFGGKLTSGIYAANSHKVLPVGKLPAAGRGAGQDHAGGACCRQRPAATQALRRGQGHRPCAPLPAAAGVATGQVMVVLVTAQPVLPGAKNFVKALLAEAAQRGVTVTTVVQNVNSRKTSVVLGEAEKVLYGKGFILDTLCGKTYAISPRSFYQINHAQTEVLYGLAVEAAKLTGKEVVLDAYCGIGTIGLTAADHAKQVVGVELNRDAVQDAIGNARHNGVKNARFFAADATRWIGEAAAAGEKADVIFMDPPREGSTPEFLASVARMAPKRVVYVSCNPVTLARDLATLTKLGYKAEGFTPVDMFPHTEHIETVVLLSKGEVDSKKIRVEFSLEDMDMSEFQDGATYPQIKEYVLEHTGLKVSNLYISQIKRKCVIGVGKNYNLPKSEDSRQPQCPPEKEKAIREAFKYFGMI